MIDNDNFDDINGYDSECGSECSSERSECDNFDINKEYLSSDIIDDMSKTLSESGKYSDDLINRFKRQSYRDTSKNFIPNKNIVETQNSFRNNRLGVNYEVSGLAKLQQLARKKIEIFKNGRIKQQNKNKILEKLENKSSEIIGNFMDFHGIKTKKMDKYIKKLPYDVDEEDYEEDNNCEAKGHCNQCKQDVPCENKRIKNEITGELMPCCEKHKPLSSNEREKRVISSLDVENEFDGKCQYVAITKRCNKKTSGKYCESCAKIKAIKDKAYNNGDFCTRLMLKGPRKNQMCGEPSYEKGYGKCKEHANEGKEPRYCLEIIQTGDRFGQVCGAKIKHPTNKKCDNHINSSMEFVNLNNRIAIALAAEANKDKDLDSQDLEIKKAIEDRENKIIYCSGKCANGTSCNNKARADCNGMCATHDRMRNKLPPRRCTALNKDNEICNRLIKDDDDYCDKHPNYNPSIRSWKCMAIVKSTKLPCNNNICVYVNSDGTLDRAKTVNSFCGIHKNSKEEDAIDLQTRERLLKEHKDKMEKRKNKHSEVFNLDESSLDVSEMSIDESVPLKGTVKPPKGYTKLFLDNPDGTKTLVNPIKNNYSENLLPTDMSFTTESSECTSEEEKVEEVKPKRVVNMKDEEFEAVNALTGWTKDEITVMRNKKLYKREVDDNKKFHAEKTVFHARKKLENRIRTINSEATKIYNSGKTVFENVVRATYSDMNNSVKQVMELSGGQIFMARSNLIPECREQIKKLRGVEEGRKAKLAGLPKIQHIEDKYKAINCEKYIKAFEDVIETVQKELKQDTKFLRELMCFRNGITTGRTRRETREDREGRREELKQLSKEYFIKFLVRFAKAALHDKIGNSFGFAEKFIERLKQLQLDYTKFAELFGGEVCYENGYKVYYGNMKEIITELLEENKDTATMNYMDVDISTNLSLSMRGSDTFSGFEEFVSKDETLRNKFDSAGYYEIEKFNSQSSMKLNKAWYKEGELNVRDFIKKATGHDIDNPQPPNAIYWLRPDYYPGKRYPKDEPAIKYIGDGLDWDENTPFDQNIILRHLQGVK